VLRIQLELIILFLHLLLALAYTIFILSGKSHLQKEQFVLLYLIPIFGVFAAIIIEFMIIFKRQGKMSLDLEPTYLSDDILWKPLKSFHEKGDLVPLEEVILINETKIRRRFMLEILYSDPYKYLDILNIAKFNEDMETSHYATTTISKAQKDFQLSVQKLTVEVENHPENVMALDSYIETLGKYIKSGLLEEHLLKNLRLVYSTILDKKLQKVKSDKRTLIEKLRNNIELKDYITAFETSDLLKNNFPQDEETWIEALRVCVEGNDASKLQETINEIRLNDIAWTKQGKDQLSPWLKVTKNEAQ
jgi:hypothetical protein